MWFQQWRWIGKSWRIPAKQTDRFSTEVQANYIYNLCQEKECKGRMIIAAIGKKKPEKKIRASTGFEPVTSAIPVRCSTNWAMKPHIGSKGILSSSEDLENNSAMIILHFHLQSQFKYGLFHIYFKKKSVQRNTEPPNPLSKWWWLVIYMIH